jgi:hypothetical protein
MKDIGHLDLNVYDFVSFVNSDRTRLSQNPSLTLKVPFCKTRTFQASYFNRIVKLWNTTCKILPRSSFSSLSTFKCSIKLFSISMLINRVHVPSYVVAPAIGHKLTFFRGSAPHGTWSPVRTFPNSGFFCCCYFKLVYLCPIIC